MLYKTWKSSALLYLRFIRAHMKEVEDGFQLLKGVQRQMILMRRHYRPVQVQEDL